MNTQSVDEALEAAENALRDFIQEVLEKARNPSGLADVNATAFATRQVGPLIIFSLGPEKGYSSTDRTNPLRTGFPQM